MMIVHNVVTMLRNVVIILHYVVIILHYICHNGISLYNDDTSHYVIMIFYYGLVVHVLYFVILTFLAWLFIICVLNFPRVCYFRFLNLFVYSLVWRVYVHSVKADVCLFRDHSPRSGNFSPFYLRWTTSNFKVFVIIFMV